MTITLMMVAILLPTTLFSIAAFTNKELLVRFMFSPYRVVQQREYYRLFSHSLLHSGWMHLIFNMYVFYAFGLGLQFQLGVMFPSVDGGLMLLLVYVVGLLFSNVPSLLKHHNNEGYSAIGASGAVSAVVFASILLNPTSNITLYLFEMKAFIFGFLYLLSEAIFAKRGETKIAHNAHIAGALAGIGLLILLDYTLIGRFFGLIGVWFNSFF